MGEGEGEEHLALDPLKGDERDESQGDDGLAENARLADLENAPGGGGELARGRPRLHQMALDVLDLDDSRIDDHTDGDGQSAQGHKVCTKAEKTHHDESEQGRKREGKDNDKSAPEAAQKQVENEDDEEGADNHGFGDRLEVF